MEKTTEYAVSMRHITKTFGKVVANHDVSLDLREGEILALLGENGSGKTTLMNMLSGIYYPDHGEILIHGKPASIRSPREAFDLGIGMIHQHFKLVDVLTAAENIVLGLPGGAVLGRKELERKVAELAGKYGFEIDPAKKIYNMSVSEKQTVEILKVLYRGADILILDEPTAVLTPQETEKLFAALRNMKKDGKSIIIITHKLYEVLSISDRVAILRKGEYIGAVDTGTTNQDELTEMMVGRPIVLEIERPEVERGEKRLQVVDLTCQNGEGVTALDNVSFDAYGGEILGIAGLDGSGRTETLETIFGVAAKKSGTLKLHGKEIRNKTPREAVANGFALLTEERRATGIFGILDIQENTTISSLKKYLKAGLLSASKMKESTDWSISAMRIKTPNQSTKIRSLSGGNQQKVILGRWLLTDPEILLLDEPTRGIDVGAKYEIYQLIIDLAKQGKTVIMVSSEMPELLGVCDRILVMSGCKLAGEVDAKTATQEEIMTLAAKYV